MEGMQFETSRSGLRWGALFEDAKECFKANRSSETETHYH